MELEKGDRTDCSRFSISISPLYLYRHSQQKSDSKLRLALESSLCLFL